MNEFRNYLRGLRRNPLQLMCLMVVLAVLAVLAFTALAANVEAQETTNRQTLVRSVASTMSVEKNLASGQIVTNALDFTVPDSDQMAVQLTLNGLGAGATNTCTVQLEYTVDEINYVTGPSLSLTGGGASTRTAISNLHTYAASRWRVRTMASTANGTGTNLDAVVSIGTKRGI